MMKQLVCLAAGVGIGYFVAQTRLEKYYNARLVAENEFHEFHKNDLRLQIKTLKTRLGEEDKPVVFEGLFNQFGIKMDEVLNTTDHETEEKVDMPAQQNEEPSLVEAAKTAMTNYSAGAGRINPLHFAKDFHIPGDEDRVEAVIPDVPNLPEFLQQTPEEPTFEEPSDIQILTPKQFQANDDEYAERTFQYWAVDGALSNEENVKFKPKEMKRILGSEVLHVLQQGPPAFIGENENSVYIRNTVLKSNIDVVWVDGSFAEEFEGE
jgi:hypothetical protein